MSRNSEPLRDSAQGAGLDGRMIDEIRHIVRAQLLPLARIQVANVTDDSRLNEVGSDALDAMAASFLVEIWMQDIANGRPLSCRHGD